MNIAGSGPNANNDTQWFTELFGQYSGKMFHYFKKHVREKHIAEDLVQEVFTSIWHHHERLLRDKNIEAYLFVSARNRLYNHLRQTLHISSVDETENDLAFSYSPINEIIASKETYSRYLRILFSLSGKRREAFILSREQGMSYSEISQKMGIS